MSRGHKKTAIPEIVQDFIDATLPDEKFGQFLSVLNPDVVKTRKVKLDDIANRLRALDSSCVSDEAIKAFVDKLQNSSAIRKSTIKPAKITQFLDIIASRQP